MWTVGIAEFLAVKELGEGPGYVACTACCWVVAGITDIVRSFCILLEGVGKTLLQCGCRGYKIKLVAYIPEMLSNILCCLYYIFLVLQMSCLPNLC